jgi:hypothetical protein
LQCSKEFLRAILKEHNMTHANLHQAVPVAVSEKVTEVFSGLVLVLSGVLTLVTLASL